MHVDRLSYLIFLSYYGAYVYVYRVSLFIYFYFLFTLIFFSTCIIVYCLFVKIVRNKYEYHDKFLICVNVFGNKPFLLLISDSHLDLSITFPWFKPFNISLSLKLCGFTKTYFQPHFTLQHSLQFLQEMHFLVIIKNKTKYRTDIGIGR